MTIDKAIIRLLEIYGIDNVKNNFMPENALKFDSYLSIGDVYVTNLTHRDRNFNGTLISYYDKIQNFTFDPQALEEKWAMQFDWNISRIRSQNISVHEEIKVPKSFNKSILIPSKINLLKSCQFDCFIVPFFWYTNRKRIVIIVFCY